MLQKVGTHCVVDASKIKSRATRTKGGPAGASTRGDDDHRRKREETVSFDCGFGSLYSRLWRRVSEFPGRVSKFLPKEFSHVTSNHCIRSLHRSYE